MTAIPACLPLVFRCSHRADGNRVGERPALDHQYTAAPLTTQPRVPRFGSLQERVAAGQHREGPDLQPRAAVDVQRQHLVRAFGARGGSRDGHPARAPGRTPPADPAHGERRAPREEHQGHERRADQAPDPSPRPPGRPRAPRLTSRESADASAPTMPSTAEISTSNHRTAAVTDRHDRLRSTRFQAGSSASRPPLARFVSGPSTSTWRSGGTGSRAARVCGGRSRCPTSPTRVLPPRAAWPIGAPGRCAGVAAGWSSPGPSGQRTAEKLPSPRENPATHDTAAGGDRMAAAGVCTIGLSEPAARTPARARPARPARTGSASTPSRRRTGRRRSRRPGRRA